MQIDLNAPLAVLLVAALAGLVWLSKWIGGVNEHKSEVGRLMQEIRTDIKKIFQRLPSEALDRDSPIRLTDLGDEMATRIDAGAWAAKEAVALRERVEGRSPYRIQNFAYEYAHYEYRPDERFEAQLEAIAYEKGISKEEVLDVLAIALRDELAGPGAGSDNQGQEAAA